MKYQFPSSKSSLARVKLPLTLLGTLAANLHPLLRRLRIWKRYEIDSESHQAGGQSGVRARRRKRVFFEMP
jgi:hypothetical protein